MLVAVVAPRALFESYNQQPPTVSPTVYPRSAETGFCPDYGKDFMSCTPIGAKYCQCTFH